MSARYRTHSCGSLRAADVGNGVVCSGFVSRLRDHGGLVFIDLRDRSGVVQVVLDPAVAADAAAAAHALRVESVVRVEGSVVARQAGTVNADLATGEIEIAASALEVLSLADPLPFQLHESGVDETLRLRHRALDLRRDEMTARITARSRITSLMRRFLEERGFLDLETPNLTKSTPEGARDFLVPARMAPGSFYALPQSPQLFKQLYMLAGFERYYQIARCFRDEAQRADRQLEFTQLDVEMSFVERDDVMELMEELYAHVWEESTGYEVPRPVPRIPYDEAMLRYGSDRPDLRFGMVIADVSDAVRTSEFAVFRGAVENGGVVRALAAPGAASFSRKDLDELTEFVKEWGGKGLAYLLLDPSGEVRSPIAKFLGESELDGLRRATGAQPGDAIFLAADTKPIVERVLGAVRAHLADRLGLIAPQAPPAFCWIVDFPMFERDEDEQRWVARHHMFTSPRPDDLDRLESDPGAVKSLTYDLVCNGAEVGGGSIRNHRADVQERVFRVVGFPAAEAEARFGFLLRALRFGAPPHGGIAFGLDRGVMAMTGTESIRDVIAFPKIAGGADPLTDAPTPVDETQLDDLGLALKPRPKPS